MWPSGRLFALLFITSYVNLPPLSLAQYDDGIHDLYIRDADSSADAEPYIDAFTALKGHESLWPRDQKSKKTSGRVVCSITNKRLRGLVKAAEQHSGQHWDDARMDKEMKKVRDALQKDWKEKRCATVCKCGEGGKTKDCTDHPGCTKYCKCL